MDGTLLDSMGAWFDVAPMMFAKYNIPYRKDIDLAMAGMTLKQSSEYIAKNFAPEKTPEYIFDELLNYMNQKYANEVEPMVGILEFLDKMQGKGVKMCVATMTDREMAIPALEVHNMAGYFEFITTCQEVGANKENPKIFVDAAEKMGLLPEECAVFEDSPTAMITCLKAGFQVCGIEQEYALSAKEKLEKLVDEFITDYFEILDFQTCKIMNNMVKFN